MFTADVDQTTKEDILRLQGEQVSEGRDLEYKAELPGNKEDEKKEFLADVAAMANASGGHIIYGVQEEKGIPIAIPGLRLDDPDKAILRLDSIIRDGIAPRVPGFKIRPIPGFELGPVLVVQIPKSWATPHMIAKGDSRFYSRNSNGKYPLDVSEIRSVFLASASLSERILRFRQDRISQIVANEGPKELPEGAKLILHMYPFSALEPGHSVDLRSLSSRTVELRPLTRANAWNHRFNFEGFMTYQEYGSSPPTDSYTQVFRTGAIEAVAARWFIRHSDSPTSQPTILGKPLCDAVLDQIATYCGVGKHLEWSPPLVIMLTLIGVSGYTISSSWPDLQGMHSELIRHDALLLPEVIVEEFPVDWAAALRPTFDTLWQAAGYAGCPFYSKEGTWMRR